MSNYKHPPSREFGKVQPDSFHIQVVGDKNDYTIIFFVEKYYYKYDDTITGESYSWFTLDLDYDPVKGERFIFCNGEYMGDKDSVIPDYRDFSPEQVFQESLVQDIFLSWMDIGFVQEVQRFIKDNQSAILDLCDVQDYQDRAKWNIGMNEDGKLYVQ